jgi:hypothetical protein
MGVVAIYLIAGSARTAWVNCRFDAWISALFACGGLAAMLFMHKNKLKHPCGEAASARPGYTSGQKSALITHKLARSSSYRVCNEGPHSLRKAEKHEARYYRQVAKENLR